MLHTWLWRLWVRRLRGFACSVRSWFDALARLRQWLGGRRTGRLLPPRRTVVPELLTLEERFLLSFGAGGGAFAAVQGRVYNGTVAGFSATATDSYNATIFWDDGASSTGTVTGDGSGNFTVSGSHTYVGDGVFAALVEVNDTTIGTTQTLLSYGLVLPLTYSTELGTVSLITLSSGSSVTQTGTDSGGAFSLGLTGSLSYQAQASLTGNGATDSTTLTGTVSFTLQVSGSDPTTGPTLSTLSDSASLGSTVIDYFTDGGLTDSTSTTGTNYFNTNQSGNSLGGS